MLGGISWPEILIILIIALIVFGPKRLPELGRSLGKGIREFRGSLNGESGGKEGPGTTEEIAAKSEERPVESRQT
jgi:sec-independent protein translocase protein TatA